MPRGALLEFTDLKCSANSSLTMQKTAHAVLSIAHAKDVASTCTRMRQYALSYGTYSALVHLIRDV